MTSLVPALRQYVLEPLWGGYTGAPLRAAWHQLERSQFLSEAELLRQQRELLASLLAFVHANNPYYRARFDAAGLGGTTTWTLDEFRKIPILTKPVVRAEGRRMFSDGVDPALLRTAKTGGSTGIPMEIFFTEEVSQLRNASARRSHRWAGWEVGEPMGAVWGNPIYPASIRSQLREWLLAPAVYLDTMSITPDAVRDFAREWVRVAPTLLFGHGHSLYVLACLVDELRIRDIRPKAIIATSMMLLPHERSVIELVFGLKVTDLYGCEEVGLIASECERHDGLHLNVEQVFVEILREDGTPAAPGETGLVVVTDLLNRAAPLIRYRMEDLAEVAGGPCACGRGLPLMKRVVGRTADFLKRQDGSLVAGVSLIENTLTRIPGIDQMQIVQDELLRITVRIVAGSDFNLANRADLIGYFEATFPGARIALDYVSQILPEPNGKYRFSICRVAA